MSAAQIDTLKNRLETVIALARLLERVEHNAPAIGAEQYRALVRQLSAALAREMPAQALRAILGAHPAAAEVYENLHYAQAGLSQASLELSIESEKAARQVMARAAKRASP